MTFIESNSGNSDKPVNLYVQDIGHGKPVVFISGWPLSSEMWEYQLNVLPKHFLRCIAYDRRGFGKSDKPWEGYDYDTLAGDLNAVLEELDLHDVTLVGFSMGGGEVARYMSKYGDQRISKVVFISSVVPFMLKTESNPDGLPKEMFDEFVTASEDDRPKFLAEFAKGFYGNSFLSPNVSDEIMTWHNMLALQASGRATSKCIRSFSETDFREDLKVINVPTLIIHGDADKTVPIEVSGKRTAELMPAAEYIVYENAPHGLFITEKERLNDDLIRFIAGKPLHSEVAEQAISAVQNGGNIII
ncbi:alpha/beta fold hydrolase [Dyadobacter sp. CY356]|uniref:alpha/beta fold hydrolase n=1 Tax=Dyadobacter sp. CY356 TaxID=2906442 RepID=UPI001F235041|nr:alpha/beta hydrolase [Dyadobacter sp. CY356]MCF0056190.1 alpha/beta hydrolase [Dyadobacter sp. CY356]